MIKLKKKHSVPTKVPHADCVPNTWNMNQMQPSAYKKLKAWLERSYKESGKLALPIVIRTHPKQSGKWEIIDGYHRWKAAGELGKTEVDCWVYECDDKAARLLTDALNYLRGDPNPDKYGEYLKDLAEHGVGRDEITQFTHVSAEELDDLVATHDIKLEDVSLGDSEKGEDETSKEKDTEEWIEMKFLLPKSAAEIVEAEIARIGDTLTGKNIRGRALEFAMVQSAQTPLPDQTPEERTKLVKKKLSILSGKKRKVA